MSEKTKELDRVRLDFDIDSEARKSIISDASKEIAKIISDSAIKVISKGFEITSNGSKPKKDTKEFFWECIRVSSQNGLIQKDSFDRYYYLFELGWIEKTAPDTSMDKAESIAREILSSILKLPADRTKRDENVINNPCGEIVINSLRAYVENNIKGSIKDFLLHSENVRAGLPVLDSTFLTDIQRGHWDLWEGENNGSFEVSLKDKIIAHNPKADIRENSVVTIDFGTKSTVVVFDDGDNNLQCMRIGERDTKNQDLNKLFENPTIIHFENIEAFTNAYAGKKGRPNTKWDQINVSHVAYDKFVDTSSSSDFYSYLCDIKQWAGKVKNEIRIKSAKSGNTVTLPSFDKLTADDINPIEIYAYYLGLYINRMDRGIYLNYYLSFPVNYDKATREKILESFEKGIKKSLPVTVLNDKEIMEGFSLNGEISEPSAYAVCALREYGIMPTENEEISYGVFDFGGGTTDFDFGIWRKAEKGRYQFEIEDFEEYAGGKVSLGGENLLKMLAFEVFRDNIDILRKNDVFFTGAPMATVTSDIEDCCRNESEAANRNMCNLMEALRPFWELSSDEAENIYKTYVATWLDEFCGNSTYMESNVASEDAAEEGHSADISINLHNKSGDQITGVKLKVDYRKLFDSICREINAGITSFFKAYANAQADYVYGSKAKKGKITAKKLYIFLAGNSCKSPVVKALFEKHISDWEETIKKEAEININEPLIVLLPPLGTDEAYKVMKARGIEVPEGNDKFLRPTCKTGVAFGLYECRKGSIIKRKVVKNSDETAFRYFLGYPRYNDQLKTECFECFSNNKDTMAGKPLYNRWYRFIEADIDTFDICYTDVPDATSGNYPIKGSNGDIRKALCRLDAADVSDDAYVYIRAVGPQTIQYAVLKDNQITDDKLRKIYTKELTKN